MDDKLIVIPASPGGWFLQSVYSAMVGMVAYSVSPAFTPLAVLVVNLAMLSRPKAVILDPSTRTLAFRYRLPYAWRRTAPVDLSRYVLVYSQAESYAGRSVHLSGPAGEHMRLAHFHQHTRYPDRHLEEVAALRAAIARALGIRDGGEL